MTIQGGPNQITLDEAGSVTLDASGNGTVELSTPSTRTSWFVNLVSVNVTSNTSEPVAKVYLNSTAQLLGGTYTGSNDVFGPDCWVRNGSIICKWTGGDAGAKATMTLGGTVYVG